MKETPTPATAMVEALREALARVVFCREAVELGEPAVAVAILRDLEADLRTAVVWRQRHSCPECGTGFDFAGALDHHLRFVHGVEEELP
jgi:hypothetical protein